MVFEGVDFSLSPIEAARRAAAGRYIDLTSSNPTHQGLLFPAEILERAAASYWRSRRYEPHPRGLLPAREAIAAWYRTRRPAYQPQLDDIIITASTSEAYSHLFALLTEPGDRIIGPDVTYPLFQYLAELHHLELVTYRLDPERDWSIDSASVRAQVNERTKAILIISPHNPTGAVITEPDPVLAELGIPLLCDEVFAPFAFRVPSVPPLASLYPSTPVFMLNGLSKLLGLPDLKLGWIIMNEASSSFSERLELINDIFLSCSTLAQHMLPELLREGVGFVETMVERVRGNIAVAQGVLGGHGRLELRVPAGGYNLFPRVRNCSDDEQLVVDLIGEGVLVHPGFFFDHSVDTRIMISCLTDPERFKLGVERLGAALAFV